MSTGTAAMNTGYPGEKAETPKPCTPLRTAYNTTDSVKNPSTATRTNAPTLGIHLPYRNDTIADTTANQMNASANRIFGNPFNGAMNSLKAETARIVSVPPSQIGLDSQYSTVTMAAVNRPNARRVHTDGPPSNGNAEPSSAMSSPYGTKKNRPRNSSQVKPCAPLVATAPMVSRPTSVQMRKKTRSNRRKLFRSLDFSSISSVVRSVRANAAGLSATMQDSIPSMPDVAEEGGEPVAMTAGGRAPDQAFRSAVRAIRRRGSGRSDLPPCTDLDHRYRISTTAVDLP